MLRLVHRKLFYEKPRSLLFCNGHWNSNTISGPFSSVVNFIDPQSSTVSYLQKSCGLSLGSAILASKKLNIESTHNPDSVLELLRTLGFTSTHIRSIITTRPSLLIADLDDKLKPNVELFLSLGFSGTTLVKLVNRFPSMLDSDAYSMVKFFRAHGFSDVQIKCLTMKRPNLYRYNLSKYVKPKFDFLKSLGFTDLELARVLSAAPYIIERSLENQITPCIQLLRQVLGTDENVVKAIKACYRMLELNLEKVLPPNLSMLRNIGVPELLVQKILINQPKTVLLKIDHLREITIEVLKLGFEPKNILFVLAIRSMAIMTKTLWEQKLEAFGSFGLSKNEIYSAFKLQPMCMLTSEKKIKKLMPFFINRLNMKPSVISKNPNLLLLSLEKRIIPRCSVLQLLISTGIIKEDVSIVAMLRMTEKRFVDKLVSKYQKVLPDVVKAHQGKIEFQGFPVLIKMKNVCRE